MVNKRIFWIKYFLMCASALVFLLLTACAAKNASISTERTTVVTETAKPTETVSPTETSGTEEPVVTAEKVIQKPSTETPEPTETTVSTAPPKPIEQYEPTFAEKAARYMEEMSVEQKIGQMFICASGSVFDGAGGVVMFADDILSELQITEKIQKLQGKSDIPLFVAVDEEGGRVARTGRLNVPRISAAYEIGRGGDYEDAYEAAAVIAGYLGPLGFNVDFAPVADVFTNPDNTVIGDRAFSENAEIAGEMAAAFVRGLNDNGLSATLKHFPGHGDTAEDSHYGIAATYKTLLELEKCEFVPFKLGINAGAHFVMIGHISAPNVSGNGTNGEPAVFSKFLIQDVLRGDIGFEGIVITDALNMGAVTKNFTAGETAVKAVLAGVDVLLMPADVEGAFGGLKEAVDGGVIGIERIDESVLRILTVKYEMGLVQ